MTCVQERIPLSGPQSNPSRGGIEECKTVVAEMGKMLAGATEAERAAVGSGSELQVLALSVVAADGGVSPTDTKPNKEEDEELSLENDLMEQGADVDPVLMKARELATQDLCHVAVHHTAEAFERDIKSRIHNTHRAAVIIEAPTSKARIFAEFLKMDCFPHRMTLWIPVGSRFDLLPFVLNLVQKRWKDRQAFVVTLGGDMQGTRTKSSYAIYIPLVSGDPVPTVLSLSGCRAKSSEALRFRCPFEDCKYRGVCPPYTNEAEGADENKDIDADDLDNTDGDFEADEEDDQAEEDAVREGEEKIACEGPKKKRLVNIFPFARPVAFYKRILNDVMKAGSLTHLVVLTRTAHPGVFIAGLESRLEVVAFVGAKPHSIGHGQDLLQKLATMRVMNKAQTMTTTKHVKRVCASGLSFINLQAPQEQTIRMKDIVPVGASWRAGFNKNPMDLEEKVLALLQLDLEEHDLYIAKATDNTMSLFTRVSRKEGDLVCSLRSLLFDTLGRLESFLSTSGNKFLGERLLKISGCLLDEGETGSDVYAVLVGCGRYLKHFLGVRKGGPNVEMVVDPSQGACDKFLSLVVKTRNNAGIAAKTQVVANFGADWDASVRPDLDEPDAKRFKGVLDSYLEKMMTVQKPAVYPQDENKKAACPQEDEGAKNGAEAKARKAAEAKTNVQKEAEDKDKAAAKDKAQKEAVDKNKDLEEQQKQDVEKENKEAEDKNKGAEDKMKKEQQATNKERADALGSGVVVGTFDLEGVKAVSVVCSNNGDLLLVPPEGSLGNKKIPPKCVLWTTKKGKVQGSGGFEWTFAAKGRATLVYSLAKKEVISLGDFIIQEKSKSVVKHDPATFHIGIPPKDFTTKEVASFQPDDAGEKKLLQIVKELASVSLVWMVKCNGNQVSSLRTLPIGGLSPSPRGFFTCSRVGQGWNGLGELKPNIVYEFIFLLWGWPC